MNICFVYKHYPIDGNHDSGIGRYLYELTEVLRRKHQLIVITTSLSPRVIKRKNFIIYAIAYPSSNRRTINFLLHLVNIVKILIKVIKKHKIQVIEFANWESEGLLFSLTANKIMKIPAIVRLHTPSYVDNNINGGALYFSEKLMELCENIFVNLKENILISSTVANSKLARKTYNVKKVIKIIPLGIKIKNIKQRKMNSYFTKILYVGRLDKRKGVDTLLKAVPKVLNSIKSVKFTIIGREKSNNSWLSLIKNNLSYENLESVNFIGYIENPKLMDQFYINSDICVVPSRYESFGITVIEPMVYKKAVVASNVGGIREIITSGENGILIPPGDVNKLASAITNLVRNKKLRSKIGQSAFLSVRDRWNSEQMATKTDEFYKLVVNRKHMMSSAAQ